jgi:hypothetical protein
LDTAINVTSPRARLASAQAWAICCSTDASPAAATSFMARLPKMPRKQPGKPGLSGDLRYQSMLKHLRKCTESVAF